MLYFVYRAEDKHWLGTVEAGSDPEAAGQAQRAYGGRADEGGLLVSVLPPSAFRSQGEAGPGKAERTPPFPGGEES
jgi:hypothetical protein